MRHIRGMVFVRAFPSDEHGVFRACRRAVARQLLLLDGQAIRVSVQTDPADPERPLQGGFWCMGIGFVGHGDADCHPDGEFPVRLAFERGECDGFQQFHDFLPDTVWHFLQCNRCSEPAFDEQGICSTRCACIENLYPQRTAQLAGSVAPQFHTPVLSQPGERQCGAADRKLYVGGCTPDCLGTQAVSGFHGIQRLVRPFIATRVQCQPPCTDDSHRILAEPARYRLDVDIPQTWHGHRFPAACKRNLLHHWCMRPALPPQGPLPVCKGCTVIQRSFYDHSCQCPDSGILRFLPQPRIDLA